MRGWDTKALLRLIVTSSTYRQSSAVTPRLRELDPDNRLLARGARFRLSAEEIRDGALAASGLLTDRIGGRSVYPYQPDNFNHDAGNLREWQWPLESGAELYRRGLYTFLRRTSPYQPYQTFDAPARGECTVARSRTNTPLQALVTLNDPAFVESARVIAERTVRSTAAKTNDRVTSVFRTILSRAPTERERSIVAKLYESERERYLADPKAASAVAAQGRAPKSAADPVDVAAWAAVATALLNLDETITRE